MTMPEKIISAPRPLSGAPPQRAHDVLVTRYRVMGATALPAVCTAIAGPHYLLAVAVLTAALSLTAAIAAVLADLPRLYWICAYRRLVKRGAATATTSAEVRELILALGTRNGHPPAPGDLPESS